MIKNFKYLDIISVAFVVVLLVSNIASTKITQLGWLVLDGGTILFPLSYIFGDVLTEVYGYSRSRKVIWMGLVSIIVMALVFWIVGILPAATSWENQASYDIILGQTPRIVLGSLLAFFAGEFINSYILAKLKICTKGKYLWLRTISSTLVGELADSLIFVIIAFFGTLSNELIFQLIIFNYIFKSVVEIVFTPLTYLIVGILKKHEHFDFYDIKTNFNPFTITKD